MQKTIEELNTKIDAILSRYENIKDENQSLQNELLNAKAYSEAKDTQIKRLEEENASKDVEIEEIVKKIELALGQTLSKKITLTINGSRFDIDLDDGFANYMEGELEASFNVHGNNDIKTLLQAYIKKNHELFESKQMLERSLKKLS